MRARTGPQCQYGNTLEKFRQITEVIPLDCGHLRRSTVLRHLDGIAGKELGEDSRILISLWSNSLGAGCGGFSQNAVKNNLTNIDLVVNHIHKVLFPLI